MRSPTRTPEERLIQRTSRRIALQTAAVFTVSILALAGLAAGLVVHTQDGDARQLLRQAISDTDAITNPPADILIYQEDRGLRSASPGFSTGPIDPAAFQAVLAGGGTETTSGRLGDRTYLVRTQRRDMLVIQAALDLTDQQRDRGRLLNSLGAASAVGVVVSLLVGRVIARRSIRPLGLAMTRQYQFIADASHELRTPLTQAHTRAQLLRQRLRGIDHPALADEADRLVRSTRQLGEIVEELLLSSQLRTEPQTFGAVDLVELAAEVIDADRLRASAKGITVDLVADGGAHAVRGTASGLRRVLNTLVDNALGHTTNGGHIVIDIGATTDSVTCVVRDDGAGFDPADVEHVFERFAHGTAHGTIRRFGLGLSLAREVVTAHGGTIVAAGQPGHGATFTVTLPAWQSTMD